MGYLQFVSAILAGVLFSFAVGELPVPIDLGLAAPYVILAGTAVSSTGVDGTIVTGDIGVSPGTAVSGFPPGIVNGAIIINGASADAQGSLTTAYNVAAGLPFNETLSTMDLGGMTLRSNVYKYASAAEMNGILTLDANGDPDAVWVFQIASSLLVAEGSSIIFKDSIGNPDYVYWQVGSSATIGASVPMIGNILALASITVNIGATVNGRCLARNAAVSLDKTVLNIPTTTVEPADEPSSQPTTQPSAQPTSEPSAQPSSQPNVLPTARPSAQPNLHPTSQPSTQPSSNPTGPRERPYSSPEPVDLGYATPYAVLAFSTVTSSGTVGTIVTGNIGLSPGTSITGFPPAILYGERNAANVAAFNAKGSLTTAYNLLAGLPANETLSSQDLGGMILTPQVYYYAGAAALNGILTLDALGNPDAVWVFQVDSSLLIAESSNIIFKDSIGNPDYVYWQVGSSATIGLNVPMIGNILALASITVNDGASVVGRCLARNAAVTLDNNKITLPSAAVAFIPTPTSQPSSSPSTQPSAQPTSEPSAQPSAQPSSKPSVKAIAQPTSQPSAQPAGHPSSHPISHPSTQPTGCPSSQPTAQPSCNPSVIAVPQPTSQPSTQPTGHPSVHVVVPTNPNALDLGLAASYAILAGSTVTSTGTVGTIVTGNIGISPGTALVGFPPAILNGEFDPANTASDNAQGALTTAYNTLAAKPSTGTLTNSDLAGMTLLPGVYKFAATAAMNGILTLDAGGDGNAVWTFQVGSTLLVAQGSSIIFKDSIGNPDYVYWQVGSTATIAVGVPMVGNILALTSIIVNDGATVQGRCLARNAEVTLDRSLITKPVSSGQSTMVPSSQPSAQPSGKPTVHVLAVHPTSQPSGHPTQQPNSHPSSQPSGHPTKQPRSHPTAQPSARPSGKPSVHVNVVHPTSQPSAQPSGKPSVHVDVVHPTSQPSAQPSGKPSVHVNVVHPTSQPSAQPLGKPSMKPNAHPTSQPSSTPTGKPSPKVNALPTSQPSSQPSMHPTTTVVPVVPFHDTPLDLGLAQPYAILAGSTVTSTGTIGTVVTGDIGIFPGSAITGFPPAVLNGKVDSANGASGGAQGSLTTAYNVLAAKPFNTTLSDMDLGGMMLLPGVYKFDAAATMNGMLTLDADGDAAAIWTFQIGSSLLIAEGSSFIFKDSIGNPDYVYWQVGSSVTLAKGVPMVGNILALASITVHAGASVSGRCLARNAAVTLDNNKITMPNVVSFSATQTVSGISLEQYNADPELNAATLKQAIADSMTGVLPSNIQNLEVTAGPSSAASRISLRSVISALSTDSIILHYDVIVSSTMTSDQLRQELTTSVENGDFNNNLHAAAAEGGASSLDNATSDTITTEPIVTDDTNDTPATGSSDSSALSGGAIAAIVIGVVVGVVLLAMICYFFYFLYAGGVPTSEEHGSNPVPTVDASEIELSGVESSQV